MGHPQLPTRRRQAFLLFMTKGFCYGAVVNGGKEPRGAFMFGNISYAFLWLALAIATPGVCTTPGTEPVNGADPCALNFKATPLAKSFSAWLSDNWRNVFEPKMPGVLDALGTLVEKVAEGIDGLTSANPPITTATNAVTPPWGQPANIVSLWDKDVQSSLDPPADWPGPQFLLYGRMLLFSSESKAVCTEGEVTIKLFDEDQKAEAESVPVEQWYFTNAELQTLAAKDELGWGYTLKLPTKCTNGIRKARIELAFQPSSGPELFASSGTLWLKTPLPQIAHAKTVFTTTENHGGVIRMQRLRAQSLTKHGESSDGAWPTEFIAEGPGSFTIVQYSQPEGPVPDFPISCSYSINSHGPGMRTNIFFFDQMVSNQLSPTTRKSRFIGRVAVVRSLSDTLDFQDSEDQPLKGGFTLECTALTVTSFEQLDPVSKQSKIVQHMSVEGRLTFSTIQVAGVAESADFDESKDTILFTGSAENPVELKAGGQTITGRSILYHCKTGAFEGLVQIKPRS